MPYFSNSDKILQSVLSDSKLIEQIGYNPLDYTTISDALNSDNVIICTIAKIIDKIEQKATKQEIYNEISNYLKNNI